jgi:chitinase
VCEDPHKPCEDKVIFGYFTQWGIYGRNYQPTEIPANKMTHLLYSFFDIDANCNLASVESYPDFEKTWNEGCVNLNWNDHASQKKAGNIGALKQMRDHYSHLKLLFSLGGWTLSKHFSKCTLTDESRKSIAKQCADLIRETEWDGIDLDWEYPGGSGAAGNSADPADAENYLKLIDDVRAALDQEWPNQKLVTIATGMGPTIIDRLAENGLWSRLCSSLDFVNLMTYDYNGGWSDVVGHNAPLYGSTNANEQPRFNVHDGVQKLLSENCPANKLVLGTGFYGRSWSKAQGLWQGGADVGCGSWENGVFDYTHLANDFVNKNGYTRHWDDVAKVPYLYNEETRDFISYDDAESIKIKVEYANEYNLGGIMFWEISGDRDEELLDVIVDTLPNCSLPPRRLEDSFLV